jgi:hypothetical protein
LAAAHKTARQFEKFHPRCCGGDFSLQKISKGFSFIPLGDSTVQYRHPFRRNMNRLMTRLCALFLLCPAISFSQANPKAGFVPTIEDNSQAKGVAQ